MTINKFNYEAFALDYLEGKLSVELTEEMERFLATHPAIEAELSGMMEVVYLEPDRSIVFENKTALLKEEKVVWLNRKWVKPLMAAASVALLLMTYFSGYQAGVKQGDNTVVMSDENSSSNSNSNSNSSSVVADAGKEKIIVEDRTLEMPVVEEKELEKTIARLVPQTKILSKNINDTKAVVRKKNLEEITIEQPMIIVANKMQSVDNELVEKILVQEAVTEKGPIILTPIAMIPPNLVNSISKEEEVNNLSNALKVELPVENMAGITIQKKKRGIKDFLGRFPVTQLKEALIPTYYKEENAGQ